MTLRYKLRTLLILLAILPPLLWFGWTKYEAWRAEHEQDRALLQWIVEQNAGPPVRVPPTPRGG